MKYELMLILSPKLTDKEIEKTLNDVKDTLVESKSEVFAEDVWGKRDLAYPISSFRSGYYVVMNFESEPEGIPKIHKELRIQSGLIRYLLIKVPDGYTLIKFDNTNERAPRALQSKQAEELSKKVSTSKRTKSKSEEPEPKDNKLDEKLSAIINNADIDI